MIPIKKGRTNLLPLQRMTKLLDPQRNKNKNNPRPRRPPPPRDPNHPPTHLLPLTNDPLPSPPLLNPNPSVDTSPSLSQQRRRLPKLRLNPGRNPLTTQLNDSEEGSSLLLLSWLVHSLQDRAEKSGEEGRRRRVLGGWRSRRGGHRGEEEEEVG